MKFYLFLSIFCHFYQNTFTKIKPKLKRNILNFGYRINYKYEGMLVHSFDRFYVVTKFILPSIGDLKFSNLNYDNSCAYMDNKNAQNTETRKYMLDLRTFCKKIEPFVVLLCIVVLGVNKSWSCLGVRCHMYIGAPQNTTLVFRLSSLHTRRQYKEKKYATLYVYNSLL